MRSWTIGFSPLLTGNTSFLLALLFLLSTGPLSAQLNRQQAIDALLNESAAVGINPNSSIWSPFEDFGSGAGFEGLLPATSSVDPAELGLAPFPGPGMIAGNPSYFFWIDDLQMATFQHPVRFVLVRADIPNPTVNNGGITFTGQGWWPVITLPDGTSTSYFSSFEKRTSDSPAGVANPDGLIAGPAPPKPVLAPEPPAGPPTFRVQASENACALLVRGDPDDELPFEKDIERWESDMKDHYGLDANRIIKANNGEPASKGQLDSAIKALCDLSPDCDKIFLRFTSHGSKDAYCLADGSIPEDTLCNRLQTIAAKGVPICMIINGCNTGSLLDQNNWNFPAGSVVITGADADHSSYGSEYWDSTEMPVRRFYGSLLPYSHSKCLRDQTDSDGDGIVDADTNRDSLVDDAEAYDWVLKQKPCYTWTGDTTNTYPAGVPPGGIPTHKPNPNPQKVEVGRDPDQININVQNATGAPKSIFYIVFKGDVSDGIGNSWRSDENDNISFSTPWTSAPSDVTATYNKEKNETTVCWMNLDDPVAPGDFIHFGFWGSKNGLRPIRQFWSSPSSPQDPPFEQEVVPTQESSLGLAEDCFNALLRLATRNPPDGWGFPLFSDLILHVAPQPLAIELLNRPFLQQFPAIPLGPVTYQQDNPAQIPIEMVSLSLQGPEPVLVLESNTFWEFNDNQTSSFQSFPIVEKAGFAGDLLESGSFSADFILNSQAIIPAESKVNFSSGLIIKLQPPFHAEAGSTVQASIRAPCPPIARFTPANSPLEAIATENMPALEKPVKPDVLRVFPNPFTSQTSVQFYLREAATVTLSVFNLTGKKMLELSNGRLLEAGVQEFTLDGNLLPAGMYYLSLRTGEQIATEKIMVVK